MRTLQFADDLHRDAEALIARRAARGEDRYDYELGDRYVMNPPPRVAHQEQVDVIRDLLRPLVPGRVLLGCGFGQVTERGWYVIPDLMVVPGDDEDTGVKVASIAIEVRSPRESMAAKLADYREVLANVPEAILPEVWYVDGARVLVHPSGATTEGETEFPDVLQALLRALGGEAEVSR